MGSETLKILAGILFLLALIILWLASKSRRSLGLPAGRVIYTDTRAWGAVDQPLYDRESGLAGKPDYILEEDGILIPVEVKTSRLTGDPYDSHIYQLAAYCMLIERHFGKRPPYGILHYPSRSYAIDYTEKLEKAMISLLDQIHGLEKRKELARSHESKERCNRCGYRTFCEQRLL